MRNRFTSLRPTFGVPPGTCLVYTTDLHAAAYRALDGLADLRLLDADVLRAR